MLKKYAHIFRAVEYSIDFTIGIVIVGLLIKLSTRIELVPNFINGFFLSIVFLQIVIFSSVGLYSSRRFYSILRQASLIIKGTMLHLFFSACLYSMVQFLVPLSINSYLKLLGSYYVFSTLFFLLKGLSVSLALFYIRSKGFNKRYVLLVGDDWTYIHTPDEIFKNNRWGIEGIGYLSPALVQSPKMEGLKYLGNYTKFEDVLRSRVVDEIIFLTPFSNKKQYKNMIKETIVQGKNCHLYSTTKKDFQNLYRDKLEIKAKRLKRIFDFWVSLLLMVLFSPLMFVISLAVKLSSKGSVLFKQKRMGKNGRVFTLYKFRSMVADAEKKKEALMKYNEMAGPVFKIAKDPRITTVGSFLRKTSLDELPQIFNVIRGDMSLVGPRPPIPEEVAQYKSWQRKRLAVTPGITCTWQVSGRNEIMDFEDWVKLDIDYIDNYSFANDIKLLLKTIPAVLSNRGAR
ncbi:sugar transferase [Candidatus Margulisiibacteriota bacterium]